MIKLIDYILSVFGLMRQKKHLNEIIKANNSLIETQATYIKALDCINTLASKIDQVAIDAAVKEKLFNEESSEIVVGAIDDSTYTPSVAIVEEPAVKVNVSGELQTMVAYDAPVLTSARQLSARKHFSDDEYLELLRHYSLHLDEYRRNVPERTYGHTRTMFAAHMNKVLDKKLSETSYSRVLGLRT